MAASRPARPKPLDWSCPPHLAVFIRNLKLLHLDQREDWPDITLRALSPSSQNQRQRIRLIEWSLYYLFTIWDPEGAQNKLRPFFPPLEPLQSVNLRAALFRVLSDLKKNGDLGRETILRKTMLDDCKGEKFDELLAIFSTAVLRKLVAVSASEMLWNSAMAISTASSISPTDYQNIFPLILAHQVSLNATGARRTRVQQTYEQFSQLLNDKKVELTERASKETTHDTNLPLGDSKSLANELRTNWLGSEEWATALLDGGAQSSTDAFLELPFKQAWARATESTVDDLSSSSEPDPVVDLEARILRLRARLRRWHEYNDSLRKQRDGEAGTTGMESQESQLLFRGHQTLSVASLSKTVRESGPRERTLNGVDKSFMSIVDEAINRINGKPIATNKKFISKEFLEKESAPVSADTHALLPTKEPVLDRYQAPDPPAGADSPDTPVQHTIETRTSSPPIVRLSPNQDPEIHDRPDPEPLKPSTLNYTLVERTRKSMSLIPPLPAHEAQPRPRQRRGPRQSFPINQFETPRKQYRPGTIARSGASTPQDKLFEEDADYASVFKSRPRVAHSPISSPAVHVSPSLDEEDFELEYDEEDLREIDSPLVASRFRA
ncbi:hypothetical protein N7462_011181 [Penicillium macrosclerotiorum]|uniref:uncharacterized protein n=1 Tax=Penicillium macrosclerotiorum TaxID=303699 RepID=UPI0025497105|nr:uncharacterized protein N7462_011181 [Penicillium macrosclerotiorum]KAJ5666772.1 hypothetical protein N7462_011181 [Penicillium macrosclerotiorum]